MQFDSHVERLLTVTTLLVNALTPGRDGGEAVDIPIGSKLRAAVAQATAGPGYTPHPSASDAAGLAALASRAREVYEAADAGELQRAADLVNGLIADTRPQPQVDRFPDGTFNLHFHGPDSSFAAGWAAGIAAGLAIALGANLGGRLGVCAAPDCDRVYVDGSRNSSRAFCSARCQSRVKAAAHRARRRVTG